MLQRYEELEAFEGTVRGRFVRHRRRERSLRPAKLEASRRAHGGRLLCEVPGCGLDFDGFGSVGIACVEVHHRLPLRSGPVRTTLDDLAVVCANCHRLIHYGGKSRSLREVGRLIAAVTD